MDNNEEPASNKAQLEKLLTTAEDVRQDVPGDTVDHEQPVWLGTALSETEIGILSAQIASRVVFIAGMPDSGKSTLLASLYQQFMSGPFGNTRFAGSRTLPRFENIAFYSRVESERYVAATKRTKFISDEIEFVHLVLDPGDGDAFNMFVTDISGEAFEAARDNVNAVKPFAVVKRADFVCFMIDGKNLSSYETRDIAARDIDLLIDSFIQEGLIVSSSSVQIIISRIDLIVESAAPDTEIFINDLVEKLVTVFGKLDVRASVHRVAARPNSGAPIGLSALFENWFREPSAATPYPPQFEKFSGPDDFNMHDAATELLN